MPILDRFHTWRRVPSLTLVTVVATVAVSLAAPPKSRPRPKRPPTPSTMTTSCGNVFDFQVLLDRRGFSPGQIDEKLGSNLKHALAAFQQANGLPPTGQPDCSTRHALDNSHEPTVVTYTVTDEDVKGPFIKTIPRDLERQATLPALGYTSALEKLAERFHIVPALLRRMNSRSPFAAGNQIQVPAVTPFDPTVKAPRDAAAADITIQVSREESAVRVIRADGTLLFFAPVSSGSVHDPLPPGAWKVTGVNRHPAFHYNPDLFWDARPTQSKATIKPGLNNPVGVVWIDLDLEHYGLHGTPEPGNIGYTQSHGCVRLTNWDASRLATLVRPGTPVVFR